MLINWLKKLFKREPTRDDIFREAYEGIRDRRFQWTCVALGQASYAHRVPSNLHHSIIDYWRRMHSSKTWWNRHDSYNPEANQYARESRMYALAQEFKGGREQLAMDNYGRDL
jgi:hypothetical protein